MNSSCLDLVFPAVGGREVVSRNDGGDITSDAGLLLVSLADKKLEREIDFQSPVFYTTCCTCLAQIRLQCLRWDCPRGKIL